MDKKGVDLLWGTIAVALMIIIIIVISVFIFSDKTKEFNTATDSCFLKGGVCTTNISCSPNGEELSDTLCLGKADSDSESPQKQICCIRIT